MRKMTLVFEVISWAPDPHSMGTLVKGSARTEDGVLKAYWQVTTPPWHHRPTLTSVEKAKVEKSVDSHIKATFKAKLKKAIW